MFAEPTCPAAFLGISRALVELALETKQYEAIQLIDCLKNAIRRNVLSASAQGYAKELVFLTLLATRKMRAVVSASPWQSGQEVGATEHSYFFFTRSRWLAGFNIKTAAADMYSSLGMSVLFLPRKSNEPYVDAVVYNYEGREIYAIQVHHVNVA